MERHMKIIEMLSKSDKIEVSRLSQDFDVSEVTIRKDLVALEKKGLLRREKGYAILNETNEMSRRIATNYKKKLMIAIEAAKTVQDGETLMIESGSCCVLLAQVLSETKKDITLITNSLYIASMLSDKNARIILLGGEYQADFMASVGPLTGKCAQEFHVDKIFVGTDGFSQQSGFTGDNHTRVETLKTMASRASKVMVLMEAGKAQKQGVVSFLPLSEVNSVFTENTVSESFKGLLQKQGIALYLANTSEV